MTDINDGNSLASKLINNGEQCFHLRRRQRRRRLVKDQHFTVCGYCFCNLHQLHLRYGKTAQMRLWFIIQMNFFEHLCSIFVHLIMIDHRQRTDLFRGIPSHINILADAPFRNRLKLLMNHGDAAV